MAVMSIGRSTVGGVKNLRAIFENRSSELSSSPPSRGRSPNGSFGSQSRPLSKVRTSFVAVERVGSAGGPLQLGLRRTSDESDEIAIMDDAAASVPGLGAILKGSPFEDVGQTTTTAVKSAKPGSAPTPKANGTTEKPIISSQKSNVKSSKPAPPKPITTSKPPTTVQPSPKNTSPTETKKSPSTAVNPSFPKPRGGGAKILAVMESAREAQEARDASAKAKDTKAEGSKTTTPTATKVPRASLPARLNRPAGSATAPTTSSVAKTESNGVGEQKPVERKAVARGPPRVANATTASSLAKKSSRASLGVPEEPRPRTSISRAPADEGFLARMMRPTASSAKKTHDKVQAESPPRQKLTAPKTVSKKPSRKSIASTSAEEAESEPAANLPQVTEENGVVSEEHAEIVNGDGQQPQQAGALTAD